MPAFLIKDSILFRFACFCAKEIGKSSVWSGVWRPLILARVYGSQLNMHTHTDTDTNTFSCCIGMGTCSVCIKYNKRHIICRTFGYYEKTPTLAAEPPNAVEQ